ncbi:MAG: hypothetical protein BAJATHORv1_40022 [Candidatus Thorarchaeota archaeon]|nr:MAG: hypothetical protein BAJATHORv1_40022 [Candidatus Thorarchaeota archaeon]
MVSKEFKSFAFVKNKEFIEKLIRKETLMIKQKDPRIVVCEV